MFQSIIDLDNLKTGVSTEQYTEPIGRERRIVAVDNLSENPVESRMPRIHPVSRHFMIERQIPLAEHEARLLVEVEHLSVVARLIESRLNRPCIRLYQFEDVHRRIAELFTIRLPGPLIPSVHLAFKKRFQFGIAAVSYVEVSAFIEVDVDSRFPVGGIDSESRPVVHDLFC